MLYQPVTIELLRAEDLPEPLCAGLRENEDAVFRKEGKLCYRIGNHVLCTEDSAQGSALLSSIRSGILEKAGIRETDNPFFRILNGNVAIQPEAISQKYHIPDCRDRCVICFRSVSDQNRDLSELFNEIVPIVDGDYAVPVSYDTVALVKGVDGQEEGETDEYAAAVIETFESEGLVGLKAGIGCVARNLSEIRASYAEAGKSLKTGLAFHPTDRVFRYSRQALERIIEAIPAERRKEIRSSFLHPKHEDAFNDEMMETIRVFFRNDLNLSAASKQLFIHRNTLNYRLDKIRRDTGLDVRRFRDAVVLKIILEIPEE